MPETATAVATATPCALITEHMAVISMMKERDVFGFDGFVNDTTQVESEGSFILFADEQFYIVMGQI